MNLAAALTGWGALSSAAAEPRTIPLDGTSPGRVFEGIGAVSAGASSRLLIDYPEPQRSQVLDYLFKPHYGAGLQHLKVELGGDVNSTDGCEPSHQHTRTDENYQRGYEWWLMAEAKKRNPHILLDCLEWGAPAWIGNGNYYSQDNADYIVRFIQGAKRVHGLDIDFTGVWNETRHDTNWIKLLRRTLDAAGLQSVKIVAADLVGRGIWDIAEQVSQDPELGRAVHAIGVHYPHYKSPRQARDLGKPLWSSEDGPWKADWTNACKLARMYNRNYVLGRMTKTEIWSPVTSYYNNLPLPGSGLMQANEPWSGHYVVEPAIWVTAHTTQFAEPGWQYLDRACVELDGGSVVALKSPTGADYSLVIETLDAKVPQELQLNIAGLPAKPLHLWRSSQQEQFIPLADLTPKDNVLRLRVEPQCLYTLTTTSGQRKGGALPPPARPFPLPYAENFEGCQPGTTPRFFSDQAGIFETVTRADGQGRALRQVVARKGIEWHSHLNAFPETFLGATDWADYEVSVQARTETAGFVSLFGRVGQIPQNANPPNGYWLKVATDGAWELKVVTNPRGKGTRLVETVLASGQVQWAARVWQPLALSFAGDHIAVRLGQQRLAEVTDRTFRQGMVGIGCGWHEAEFDDLAIRMKP